jgi:hypothetical protein
MHNKAPRHKSKTGKDRHESGKIPRAWSFGGPSVSRAESGKKPWDARMNRGLHDAVQGAGPSRYCPPFQPNQTDLHTTHQRQTVVIAVVQDIVL